MLAVAVIKYDNAANHCGRDVPMRGMWMSEVTAVMTELLRGPIDVNRPGAIAECVRSARSEKSAYYKGWTPVGSSVRTLANSTQRRTSGSKAGQRANKENTF